MDQDFLSTRSRPTDARAGLVKLGLRPWQNIAHRSKHWAKPMTLNPESFAKTLADATRLRILMLLQARDELCVCELTATLDLPQPKISRHLAILREAEMLLDRRRGTWVYYRIHPDLPAWARDALTAIARGCSGTQPFAQDWERLTGLATGTIATCD